MSRNMSIKALSLSALLVLAAPAIAQQPAPAPAMPGPLSARLGVDPKVRIGTLPNGLRYYIRQNSRPEKRAELRLVVNAGSVLETQQQLGLKDEARAVRRNLEIGQDLRKTVLTAGGTPPDRVLSARLLRNLHQR